MILVTIAEKSTCMPEQMYLVLTMRLVRLLRSDHKVVKPSKNLAGLVWQILVSQQDLTVTN